MPLLIKKNCTIVGDIPWSATAVTGIETGTSITNQFEGNYATDWATRPIEKLRVKYKIYSTIYVLGSINI